MLERFFMFSLQITQLRICFADIFHNFFNFMSSWKGKLFLFYFVQNMLFLFVQIMHAPDFGVQKVSGDRRTRSLSSTSSPFLIQAPIPIFPFSTHFKQKVCLSKVLSKKNLNKLLKPTLSYKNVHIKDFSF